jgi:hypothetical protein
MKYEIIEHEKLSRADFAAIIQFDSCNDAMTAAKAINESSYTNSPGIASEGNTGAFRVGKYVVFNAYNQACYDKFLKIISSLESPAGPGESSVDSLARTLWDGMYDKYRTIEDDTDAAVDYIRAMFPEAEAFREDADCYYFDYDGGKYFIKLEYSIDATGKIRYGKIVVRDYDNKMKPVNIDRDTVDVKGTLEKFFKKAKPAGDSKTPAGDSKTPAGDSKTPAGDSKDSDVDSLAKTLWDGMADPDCKAGYDMDAATDYLRAMFPEVEIISEQLESFYFDYDGVKYGITLKYDRDENNQLHGGKIIVSDYDDTMEPVTIDRDTDDVKGTLEKFFKKAKPADSTDSDVETLARTLWDGMTDPVREVHVDRDAAIAYFRAMFPGAETSVNGADSFYFDYCGVKYTMVLDYDRDENDELHGGKIIVYDHKNVPVIIDCFTRDVKGTLEKFFKKAKPAGDSPDEPSLMDRLDKVDAEIKKLNNEIWKIKKSIKK